MNPKLSHRILRLGQAGSLILLLLAWILCQDSHLTGPALALCILGTVMFLGAILQALFFYRCPHCGSAFNIRGLRPDYCPRCGKRLDWQCYSTRF